MNHRIHSLTARRSFRHDGAASQFRHARTFCRRCLFYNSTLWFLLLLHLTGCHKTVAPPEEAADTPAVPARVPVALSALVLDDEALAVAIKNQWNSRSEGSLTVHQANSTTWLNTVDKNNFQEDIIVYPSHLMGELVQRELVRPVPDEFAHDPRFAVGDILPMLRLHETTWGTQRYASSFGSPALVLYYRADSFDALGLSRPTTWDDYEQLTVAFSRHTNDITLPKFALAEPLANGWAGQVLLARAAAYAKHPNNYSTLFRYKTMEPLIAGAPFVRALEQLATAASHSPPNALDLTPDDVRHLFHQGECAMALSWPAVDTALDGLPPAPVNSMAFAELPGAQQVYHIQDGQWQDRQELHVPLLGIAGRLLSVTSTTHRTRAALNAMAWLTGHELGLVLSPTSKATTIFRTTQLSRPSPWFSPGVAPATARQYGEVVAAQQLRSSWLCSLRIPGCQRYMAVLDEAVRRTVKRETSAQEALSLAAELWQDISEDLGVEKQLEAYRKSLGLEF